MGDEPVVALYQCTYEQYLKHLEELKHEEDDDNSSSNKNQISKEETK